MKRLALSLGIGLALFASPLNAQDPVVMDSVFIQVFGAPMSLEITTTPAGPYYVGDTINFEYYAIDEAGERTPALITWTVADPARATLMETSDTTMFVVPLLRGELRLDVTIQKADEIVLGALFREFLKDGTTPALYRFPEGEWASYPPGTFLWAADGVIDWDVIYAWDDPDQLGEPIFRESVLFCAFIYQGTSAIATSHPDCVGQGGTDPGVPVRTSAIPGMMNDQSGITFWQHNPRVRAVGTPVISEVQPTPWARPITPGTLSRKAQR